MNQFPINSYRKDDFAAGIGRIIPLSMVLSWIYFVMMIVRELVHEKETRVKEYMKIMGLSNLSHWTAWFITHFVMMTVSVLLLCLVLFQGGIIIASDKFLVFVLLEVYGVSTICLAFLISVFFSKARLASVCGGLIYFTAYLPYIWVNLNMESMLRAEKIMSSTLSTAAFGIAMDYVASIYHTL